MSSGGTQMARSFDPMKKGFATKSFSRKNAEVKEVATKKTEERTAPEFQYGRSEPVNMLHLELLKQKVGYEIQASEQRLKAQIDEKFAEAKQQVNQKFVETDKKIDALEVKMNEKFVETDKKIDALEVKMNEKFVETDKKIDALEVKMNEKFADTDKKIAVLDTKIDVMGQDISIIKSDIRLCMRVFLSALGTAVIAGIGTLIKMFFFS